MEPAVFEAALAAVRAALTGPELAGRTVRYLEAIPGKDRVAFDRLRDLIPEENFVPFVRLWREGFPARAGQTWLTSRFHFHLLAAASGAAGTALEVSEDYYRHKHESLLDAGTGWSVTRAGETTAAPPTWDHTFRRTATDLRRTKLDEAERLYPVPEPPAAPVSPVVVAGCCRPQGAGAVQAPLSELEQLLREVDVDGPGDLEVRLVPGHHADRGARGVAEHHAAVVGGHERRVAAGLGVRSPQRREPEPLRRLDPAQGRPLGHAGDRVVGADLDDGVGGRHRDRHGVVAVERGQARGDDAGGDQRPHGVVQQHLAVAAARARRVPARSWRCGCRPPRGRDGPS